MGLPSPQRIQKTINFNKIYRCGRCHKGQYLHIWVYEKVGGGGKARLGIIVSKRVSKLASDRNLWKRRLREAFRCHPQIFKTGYDYLIKAKTSGNPPTYVQLWRDIEQTIANPRI